MYLLYPINRLPSPVKAAIFSDHPDCAVGLVDCSKRVGATAWDDKVQVRGRALRASPFHQARMGNKGTREN